MPNIVADHMMAAFAYCVRARARESGSGWAWLAFGAAKFPTRVTARLSAALLEKRARASFLLSRPRSALTIFYLLSYPHTRQPTLRLIAKQANGQA